MTCYEVLKMVSEKDKDCLETVKSVLNEALSESEYFKVKEIKFLLDSIKIEFENELSYEEREAEDGRVKTSFNIKKLGLKGKEMDRMIFESKYIMGAISNIKKQILGQLEIK
ncbi:hypothetical protein [uncultured Parvimonas sp.]|uniref:hypothetical protein n=1 Tax=uncultured Parvimonas sp. TaxID=747372 RepID=UPI0028D1B25B|nr:hypothetical protein [uncultured Parvimonas sp.]